MSGTLIDSLIGHAARRPSTAALIGRDRVLDFEEVTRLVRNVAARLVEVGVRPRDRVALQGANSVELAVAYFGVHAASAIAVLVDADLAAHSLAMVIEDSEPSLLLSERVHSDIRVRHYRLSDIVYGTAVVCPPLHSPEETDPADLLYTTGTTGRPKGVVLTHANITAAARNISTFLGQRDTDIELVPVPLSHSFGLGRLRCMAFVGSALVPLAGLGHPRDVVDAISRHRATGLAMVPAGVALLRRVTGDLLRSAASQLRYLELCAAPIAPELRAWLLEALPNTRVLHSYGLTEASRACFVDLRSELSRRGSVGTPSPNVDVEIRDADGRPLPANTEGEVYVRGAMVMREYWKQPELTAAVLHEGWMKTGDLGVADAQGGIHLRGRASEMINVGGMKVAPAEVERLLVALPGITEAACAGVPDPNGISGQRVKAFVVASPEVSTKGVIEALRRQGIEPYKIPIAIEHIAAIPRTASGKVLRRALTDLGAVKS